MKRSKYCNGNGHVIAALAKENGGKRSRCSKSTRVSSNRISEIETKLGSWLFVLAKDRLYPSLVCLDEILYIEKTLL